MVSWQTRFPVGIFFDANDTDNAPKTRALMVAAKQNNLRDLMSTNWSPYFCEALNGQSAVIDTEDFGGKVTHVIGAIGRLAAGVATGLYNDWYDRAP